MEISISAQLSTTFLVDFTTYTDQMQKKKKSLIQQPRNAVLQATDNRMIVYAYALDKGIKHVRTLAVMSSFPWKVNAFRSGRSSNL